MIYSKFSIDNPWNQDDFRHLIAWSGRLFKNKAWELEVMLHRNELLLAELKLSFRGQDHAGLRIELGLLGFVVSFQLYDCRHWDYNKNQWTDPYDTSNNWNQG